MLVSVVIPVKDDADGLTLTLASLPDDDRLEIIIIDGGSAADTIEVIARARSRVAYWETGQDTGISDAMNRGVKVASGDYVAVLNAGDEWFADTLGRILSEVDSAPGTDVFHGTVEYVGPGDQTHRVRPRIDRMAQRMWMFHPTMFVSRQCYRRVGGYDPAYRLAMDSNWCHRAIAMGCEFREVDAPLARMARGGRSDTGFVQALGEYRRSVVAHGLASAWRAAVAYYYVRLGKALTARYEALYRLRRGLSR